MCEAIHFPEGEEVDFRGADSKSLHTRQSWSLKGKSLWCPNYGGIGSVALQALSDRQYSKGEDHTLSPELDSSFSFLEAVLGGELPKVTLDLAHW